jgi:phospholipase D
MPMIEKSATKINSSKFKVAILLAFLIGAVSGYGSAVYFHKDYTKEHLATASSIQIRFSPGGQCIPFIEQAIGMAQKQVLVQAYAFTSAKIAQALIDAHKRGVIVKILVDRSQLTAKGSQVRKVSEQGISISIDIVPGIAHNKVMIIDNAYVLTGSFNWSNAAEYRNAENLLLITDSKINKIYKENWKRRALTATVINFTQSNS